MSKQSKSKEKVNGATREAKIYKFYEIELFAIKNFVTIFKYNNNLI